MKSGRTFDSSTASDAAVALPLFGLFLLMPPLITLFAAGLDLGGVPLIVIYVFGVWIALIVCAALLARRLDPSRSEGTGGAESQPQSEPDPQRR
ncbi:MAG: hypothetical protein WBG17_02315 [Burkholderiaceae bacterium]